MTQSGTQSPDEIVAERIIAQLIDRGLIGEAQRDSLTQALAEGTFSAQDWRVLAEKALMQEEHRGQRH